MKYTVKYPNVPSAMRPGPRSAELSVLKPPTNMTPSDSESRDEDVVQANNNKDYDPTFLNAFFRRDWIKLATVTIPHELSLLLFHYLSTNTGGFCPFF